MFRFFLSMKSLLFDFRLLQNINIYTLERVDLNETFSSLTAQSILQLFVKRMAKSFIYRFLVLLPYTRLLNSHEPNTNKYTCKHSEQQYHGDRYARACVCVYGCVYVSVDFYMNT